MDVTCKYYFASAINYTPLQQNEIDQWVLTQTHAGDATNPIGCKGAGQQDFWNGWIAMLIKIQTNKILTW